MILCLWVDTEDQDPEDPVALDMAPDPADRVVLDMDPDLMDQGALDIDMDLVDPEDQDGLADSDQGLVDSDALQECLDLLRL